MDHEQALDKGAAERYALGELSGSDAEDFEAHFFDCAECAQDLRAVAIFTENAKAVFLDQREAGQAGDPIRPVKRETPDGSGWSWLWRPWSTAPAFAAVALLCLSGYQAMVVIPGLRSQLHMAQAPQAMASYTLLSLSRGDERVVEVPASYRSYMLQVDPNWDRTSAEYLCAFMDESKATRFSVRLPAPAANQPLQILMSRNQLPSGRYTVVVHPYVPDAQPQTELGRYLLILKID